VVDQSKESGALSLSGEKFLISSWILFFFSSSFFLIVFYLIYYPLKIGFIFLFNDFDSYFLSVYFFSSFSVNFFAFNGFDFYDLEDELSEMLNEFWRSESFGELRKVMSFIFFSFSKVAGIYFSFSLDAGIFFRDSWVGGSLCYENFTEDDSESSLLPSQELISSLLFFSSMVVF